MILGKVQRGRMTTGCAQHQNACVTVVQHSKWAVMPHRVFESMLGYHPPGQRTCAAKK